MPGSVGCLTHKSSVVPGRFSNRPPAVFSWFKKKAVVIRQAPPPSVISSVADDEIPRYPPFMKGLPVVPPERLLNTQKELLEHIANTAIATPEILKRYYIPALQRFASFAHLLPASQSHHHRSAGGLLRHSMEVALWALQSADKVLLDSARTPALRREMEPRWQLAVFLAGLCHDAGKPVTDVTVSNRERSAVWKPIKEDLYEWASRNQVSAYFLEWREGRARQHTVLSNLIADRMIGAGMLEWIEEGGTELIVWLMESLADNPGPGNRLHDLVIKADQASVERDLKTLGVAMAGYELGVPVERHLTDVMRRFIQEGRWLVNEPGARLWHIDGGIYLVWPAAGEEIARQINEDGIPGIPRTPDGILDMLVERKMASIREDASPENRLWKIAPAVLTEKIPDLKLPAIRLRDDTLVSSVPIPAVAGKILKENEEAKTDEAVTAVSGQKDSMPPGAESGTPQTFQEPVEAKVSPVISTPIEQPPAPQEKPVVKEKSVPKGITGAASDHAYTSNPDISLEGPVGEALKALAQDLKLGDKVWGNDVVLDSEQQVLLRWPTAFSGYGLTPKAILAELSEKTWLWIDPLAPLKKVLDREVAGVLGKFIRLKHDVCSRGIGKDG